MPSNEPQIFPMEIARARIAEELERRTGSLYLDSLDLEALPEELFALTHLRELHLNGNERISDLSPLRGLQALECLKCRETQVSDLAPISQLQALQVLDCRLTSVSDLSPLNSLQGLQHLDCSFTEVSDLAPIRQLQALQYLGCFSTEVSDLAPLSGLQALQELNCSVTQVSDLTPLRGLEALQHLDCIYTQVSDLAPLSGLLALQNLYCADTQVSDLEPLSRLQGLKYLDCSSKRVSDLSPLSGLQALWHLNCSSTQVSDLSPLRGLQALEYLNCSRTQVSDFSPVLSLPSLQSLYAYGLLVPSLPHGILSESISDNCLPRLAAHYADFAAGAAELMDVKILLLGNGRVGKTQIARWLLGEPFDHEWDSTHGIRITGQPQPNSLAEQLHLNIWDFGGQDIYHGTHALFLRGPALFLLVWAEDRENRGEYEHDGITFRNHPLAYWVDVARYQAHPDSPVLIVQNKCDTNAQEELSFPVSDEALKEIKSTRYVKKDLHTSAKERRGLAALEESLKEAIADLRKRLGVIQIGAGRLRVQQRLEAMRDADMALEPQQRQHRLLERKDFDAICAEEGGITSTDAFLHYLDANGTILFRRGMLNGRIVLDQAWALEAIYAVFERKQAYKVLLNDGGRFSRAKLGLMVWREHSDEERKLFISMMETCGICFLHRRFGGRDDENNEYIAPDLLPKRETVAGRLEAIWPEDRPKEIATFRYALLHGGLIRSIMAEIGKVAGVGALYWRGGLCAYEAQTRSRVLIEEDVSPGDWQGVIRISTQEGQANVLLQKVIEVVKRVQSKLGMVPVAVDRSSPPVELVNDLPLNITQEPSAKLEWYVSYAWGDNTPEGKEREKIVDDLCEAAKAKGHTILRDKNVLSLGDRISAFMKKIGEGNRVFVILSEKYLQSPFCMFELVEVWRNCRQDKDEFLKRVRVYTLKDVKIWKDKDAVAWASYWKDEYNVLESVAKEKGFDILGKSKSRKLMQMVGFYTQVAEILDTLTDIVQPRTFEQLERYGFDDPPV